MISERIIAELAAGNPDRHLVRDGDDAVPRAARARQDEPLEDFVVRHSEFHTVVGSLARNKVLQLSLMAIGQVVTHHVASNADPADARNTIEHDHSRDRQGDRQRLPDEGPRPDGGAPPGDHRVLPERARAADGRLHRLALGR